MRVIIDRFENESAVVETPAGAFHTLDRALLPGAKEGDVVRIAIDEAETATRRARMAARLETLFSD